MRNFFVDRFGRISEEEIEELETQLVAVLKPVLPRIEFVEGLKAGLLRNQIKQNPFSLSTMSVSKGLLVAGGVVGSIVMIITSIRGLISLFGLIGLLSQRVSKGTSGTTSQTTMA
jgi:hypothetical protein